MFTRIQTRNFRSLRGVDQELGPFYALVGPNATGKSTFLDVLGFLGDLMRTRGELLSVVQARSPVFENLIWKGEGHAFQLAVEAAIPESVQGEMDEKWRSYSLARYEVEIGFDAQANQIGLNRETLWLRQRTAFPQPVQRHLFPAHGREALNLISKTKQGWRKALNKTPGGNDNYHPEGRKTWEPSFRLGPTKSTLANLPADEKSFPACTWFKGLLEYGIQEMALNSQKMRMPSPPGLGRRFQTDGSNLPWVVEELRKNSKRFEAWVRHVRTALGDVKDISTVLQPENQHRYLILEYSNGAKVPSWLLSDGTLRLLALTIPAYLTDLEGVFLIEEPENGIHPRALETVLQSLTSMYDCQVLIATHSPVALNMLEARQLLCFAKDDQGATDIIRGDEHPALREWKQGQPDLGVLFAAGILG